MKEETITSLIRHIMNDRDGPCTLFLHRSMIDELVAAGYGHLITVVDTTKVDQNIFEEDDADDE